MRIIYHLTVLPPQMPACEALSQEISALRRHFDGSLVYLNPNQHVPLFLPRLVFGLHKLLYLRRREKSATLHHLYNPDAFPFPIARLLQRPVVYTISSGVGERRPNLNYFKRLAAVAVADERSQRQLQKWGLTNVHLVRSGVDVSRFSCTPVPIEREIRLMVGSAPWTSAQFQTKGIDALLKAATLDADLRLIFLWRGVLAEQMKQKVAQLGLHAQVAVLNRQVDVNEVLAGVHAAVTLATAPGIVKAYPHSLLDALAAGKPVLVSQAIPMADYVENEQCGVVLNQVTASDILAAIVELRKNYHLLQNKAKIVGQRDFSQAAMVDSYRRVYNHVLAKKK